MDTKLKSGRALMDLPTVAERLSVGERHIRRRVYERRIPFIKWGPVLRFDPDEIDAWIDDARKRPASDHLSLLRLRRS
jgi:excisionase family DNA binding protein